MTLTTSTDSPLLRARGLRKGFELEGQKIAVLRGVDLDIHRGETISIMGRSGAGKSTLLHVLGTLDLPDEGELSIAGRAIRGMSDAELSSFRGRSVGFVFQFHHLLPEFSTLENAAMPALLAGTPRHQAYEQASYYLERVGLAERLRHRPGELSGGEQQRVALARALVMRPGLVLADEPTGNLDEATGAQILEVLLGLREETGSAVVVVTHHESLAQAMERRLVMHDGLLLDATAAGEGA